MSQFRVRVMLVLIGLLFSLLPGAGVTRAAFGFAIEVTVEGLEGADVAVLQLVPDSSDLESFVAAKGITLPEVAVRNGIHQVRGVGIPDGVYQLVINAPSPYFREPMGYLFGVSGDQIVIQPRFTLPLVFELVPPSAQELPPCRDFTLMTPGSPGASPTGDQEEVCIAEYLADLFGPAKPLPPQNASPVVLRTTGYHFAGVTTTQDTIGVRGRSYVVDPGVCRICGQEFVAEWVMVDASAQTRWMQAGWAEVSWRDNRQYIFEYDTATNRWNWFDQYSISSGSAVETQVRYNSNVLKWQARLYWDGWVLLVAKNLVFTTADRSHNMAEQYTSTGNHSPLPRSLFDIGYLRKLSGLWVLWDSQFSGSTTEREDSPYIVNMINQYYRFEVYRP